MLAYGGSNSIVKNMAARYKRGDKHPSNAQLFFWRYFGDQEDWISFEELTIRKSRQVATDVAWKKTDKGRVCAKRGWTAANQRNKKKMSDYWKRPDVRQRVRDKHNSKSEVVSKREARLKWREERAVYRSSDEFKAIQKERNHKRWLKRKSEGKTREYDRRKWHTDIQHRLGKNMRRLVHSALTRSLGVVKSGHTFDLIGCSPRALAVHLEAQFTSEMSWNNYGTYWEVDHKMPVKLFDLRDSAQQKQAFFFENLQPLEKIQNRKKSDKVEGVSVRKIIPFKAA